MKRHFKTIFALLLFIICLSIVVYAQSGVKVYVNGMRINKDVILKDGTTYVPIRAVSESMGAQVEWDDVSKSAFITFTEEDIISKLVSDISPSVVTIIGNYNSTSEINKYNNSIMHGSGVIYKSNGYIITNAHVVKDIKNLTVVLNDSTSLPGKVLYSDEDADLAVIKIEKIGLKAIKMADESTIISGKTAIAIGTPISLSMRNTVTKGIISGCDVSVEHSYYKLLQTDAAINPGNSGGPLINSKGELIGINSSKFASIGIDNMGFAIPIDTVKYVINQFETYGYILKPNLNVELEDSWEAKIGLPTEKGVTVKSSQNDALKSGDVIISVNGIAIHSKTDLNEVIKDTYNGNDLLIEFIRNNTTEQVKIQC